MKNDIDWQAIYQDTPVCNNYAYFDTAAAAPPPLPVIEAVRNYLLDTAIFGVYLPTFRRKVYQHLEVIRQKMAQFIGAQADEISFCKNGTEAICLLARGIDWQPGDEVILPDTEMLSNIVIWQMLEKEKAIKIVPLTAGSEGLIAPQAVNACMTPRTRLISFVALSNVTGAVQPVAEICAIAAQYGVLSHVSASQAVGILPIDVQQWRCDFLSACGRKGLRTIEGVGMLYTRQPLLLSLNPSLAGWWNSSIDPQSGQLQLANNGKRLEAGCPNVPALYSLGAALDYASHIGIRRIMRRNQQLTRYAVTRLYQLSALEIYGPCDVQYRLGIIPFNIKGIDADTVAAYLEQQHIIIESGHFMATMILQRYQISKMARMSLHYFNTETEIDKMISCLKQLINEMAL